MSPLKISKDPQAVAQAFAAQFLDWAHASLQRFGRFRVALSGGQGVKPLFEALLQRRHELDWGKADFFWVDERWVPLEDRESNAGEAKRLWLDQLPGKPLLHPMWAPGLDAEAGARAYEELLTKAFGPTWPYFDLCILGMGRDGHTASLFPGAASLDEEKRRVIAVQAPDGGWRTTLTLPVINGSLRCAVVLDGKEKAAALKGVLAGDASLPLSRVRPVYTKLWFYVDKAAAGQ